MFFFKWTPYEFKEDQTFSHSHLSIIRLILNFPQN